MYFYKITKIVRALWLAERSVSMRVCKHGCGVKKFCFSRANHASTKFEKVFEFKTRQVTLFAHSFVDWNLENPYKEDVSICFCLSWHFKREKSVWKASFCKTKTDNACNLRSHLTAKMALDHSRLGLENTLLESKSGRIFLRLTSLLYKILLTNLGACKPTFYTFYTSHLRWNSTMRRCFYHTDLGQNTVFHSFEIQIALTQYSGLSKHALAFSETTTKNSKITYITSSRLQAVECLH